jgi:hypothetical protein
LMGAGRGEVVKLEGSREEDGDTPWAGVGCVTNFFWKSSDFSLYWHIMGHGVWSGNEGTSSGWHNPALPVYGF